MSTRMLWFCILTCAAFGVGGIGQSHAAIDDKSGSVYDEDDDALLYQGGDDVSLHADRIAQAVAATKPAFFDLLVFHLYREQDLGRFEQLINAAQEKVQTLRQVHDDVKKALTPPPAPPTPTSVVAMPTPPSMPSTMMPAATPSGMPAAMPSAAPVTTMPSVATPPQSMPAAMPMTMPAPEPPMAMGMPAAPAPVEAMQGSPAPDQSAAMMMTAMGTMQPTMPAQMTTMPSSGMPEAMPAAPPAATMLAP